MPGESTFVDTISFFFLNILCIKYKISLNWARPTLNFPAQPTTLLTQFPPLFPILALPSNPPTRTHLLLLHAPDLSVLIFVLSVKSSHFNSFQRLPLPILFLNSLEMDLKEKLDRFQKQQQKCQLTLSGIAASKPTPQRFTPAPPATITRASVPAVKFSNDTERLQHINSIRKSPVGAQIKRVIDLLLETRQAFTPEQINEVCYVDMNANKAVFDSLRNNPKVHYDGKRFSYKSKHDVKDKNQLLYLIRKFPEGIAVIDLKDAYPNVMEDLQALKAAGQIWLLSNFDSQEDISYPNDPRVPIKVDDDLKLLFRGIELPRDMLDVEKDLQKNGMKPATNTAKRRANAQGHVASSKAKPKKKKHEISKRTKLTNAHLPELFRN